jgi:hypothetical protein
MKRLISIISLAIVFVLLFVAVLPVQSQEYSQQAPRIPLKQSTTLNWSGYAVEYPDLSSPQNGVVTDVKGTWTVPSVSSTTSNTYSSAWVGIDGYSSSTVEQIGTEHDWYNGSPRYYAWFEMYPKPSNVINKPVRPGDTINAEVKYANSSFILTLQDIQQNWTFTVTQKSNKAHRSSAEWIVEAPWSGGVLPLASFGTISFSGASATINNHTGTISDSSWAYDAITMVTSSGTIEASPSGLSGGGSSFTVIDPSPKQKGNK